MQSGEILHRERKSRNMSLLDMCKVLDISNQTVMVWEREGSIPLKRIRSWIVNPLMPSWVREMARRMIQAQIEEMRKALNEQPNVQPTV